jgi:hypothetical protein
MNYMTLILLSGGEKHRLLVCQEVGVSHFPSLLMASSSYTAVSSDTIRFSNLESIVAKDGELMPSTGTLDNGSPTLDMPGRWSLSRRKWPNRL